MPQARQGNTNVTVDKDSSTRFHKDREIEGEEEPQEEIVPLQPIQDHCPSSRLESIPDFKLYSSTLRPVPFQDDNQWEQFLNSEIERILKN